MRGREPGAGGRGRGRAALGGALLFELKLAVLDSRQPPRLVPLALGEPCLRLDGRRRSRRSVGRREGLRLLASANPSRDGQLAERRPALRPRPDFPDEGGRSPAEQGCGGGGAGECQAHEGECRACDSRSPLLLLGAGGVRTLRAILGEQHGRSRVGTRGYFTISLPGGATIARRAPPRAAGGGASSGQHGDLQLNSSGRRETRIRRLCPLAVNCTDRSLVARRVDQTSGVVLASLAVRIATTRC